MKRTELEQVRKLIRERHGLPPPPEPRWSAPDPIADEPPAAAAPQAVAGPVEPPLAAARPIQPPPEPIHPDARAVEVDRPDAEALAEWRPDACVHRLVELLIGMRALAEGEDAPLTPLAAHAA